MQKIKLIFAAAAVVSVTALSPLATQSVAAQLSTGLNAAKTNTAADTKTADTLAKDIINLLLYIIAIISVIMLIFGGIKYATSAGDSNKVTAAKNTILYAIVGLVIAVFAYAIVNWVLTALKVIK